MACCIANADANYLVLWQTKVLYEKVSSFLLQEFCRRLVLQGPKKTSMPESLFTLLATTCMRRWLVRVLYEQ